MPAKNDVFFTAGSWEKYFIFGPSYFVRALVVSVFSYRLAIYQPKLFNWIDFS